MGYIKGLSASMGLTDGRSYIYKEVDLSYEKRSVDSPELEILRLQDAFGAAKEELMAIQEMLHEDLGEEFGHIFRTHITMIEDDEFTSEITEAICRESICAEAALQQVFSQYEELFSGLGEDDYNRQRLLDFKDIYKRILRNLLGLEEKNLAMVPEQSIVVAEDLLPSDTALMNKNHVKGIITEKGGITSHVAILAKSLGIPAAVGVKDAVTLLSGAGVVLDTRYENARICVNPSKAEWEDFEEQTKQYKAKKAAFELAKGQDAITLDGKRVELSANIGSLEDVERAVEFGAKSVGLLRTEFFFLQTRELPNEETQYLFYKQVAETFDPHMVIMRTLDIGGDKEVSCFDLPVENNPFLGLRGIRVCLKYQEIFKTQLRAMLRAAVYGNIHIMFPMVASVVELRAAKKLLHQCELELQSENIPYGTNIQIGVMVETPGAVMIADILAQECDFISIGTNDLTQYVLCADRINEHVSDYYRTCSPAVFRAIQMVIEQAHAHDTWVGICGELGSTPLVVPVLVGLGVDELSVTGNMLPEMTARIQSLDYEQCKSVASRVLELQTEEEIKAFLRQDLSI